MASQKEIAKYLISLDISMAELKKALGVAGKDFNNLANKTKNSTADMKKSVKDLSDSTKKDLSKSKSSWKDFTKGMLGAQVVMQGLRRVWIEVLKLGRESITSRRTQVEAEQKLTSALKATGNAVGISKNGMISYAKEMQNLTTISDEVFIQAQAVFTTFTKIGKEAFPDAIEAAADMSKMFGQQLSQSAIQLGTALNDPIAGVGRLRRIGISFTEEQKKSIKTFVEQNDILSAQRVILDELKNEFGGVARALADTDFGRLDQVNNQLGDAGEELGQVIVPWVFEWYKLKIKIVEATTDILRGWKFIGKEIQDIINRNTFGGALSKTIEEQEILTKAVKNLKDSRDELLADIVNAKSFGENSVTRLLTGENITFEEAEAKIERFNKAIIKLNGDVQKLAGNEESAPTVPKIPEIAPKKDGTEPVLKDLSVFEEQTKDILGNIENAFQAHNISINEYYSQRRDLAKSVSETEIEALNELLEKTTEETKVREISNQIKVNEIQLERELTNLKREEAESEKELAIAKFETQKLVDEISNRGNLVGELESDAAFLSELESLTAKHAEEKEKIIQSELDTDAKIRAINSSRVTWQKEQEELVSNHYKEQRQEHIEIVSNSLNVASDLFRGFFDLQLGTIRSTEEAIAKFEENGDKAKADRLKKNLDSQKDSARRQFNIAKLAAASEAVINGALAISKVYAQEGLFGGIAAAGIGLSTGVQLAKILSESPGFNEGGSVENGPSGVDTIHARLTKKEFVQPVDTVKYYGTDVMEGLRRKMIPRELFSGTPSYKPKMSSHAFNTGGMVASPSTQQNSQQQKESNLQIVNVVDPDLLASYLNSRNGQSVIMNVISQNAYEVRRRIAI